MLTKVYISDLVPDGAESGVGLAIEDAAGRFLFFLAGRKFRCAPGELFYAGIGGHRLPDESWLACARREAKEELGAEVDIVSSHSTWRVGSDASVERIEVEDDPRPAALYEMVHPPGAPNEGGVYYIAIFRASLIGTPGRLPIDEVRAVIALTREQVVRGIDGKPSLGRLLGSGAETLAEAERVDRDVRLYPIGTAFALSTLMRKLEIDGEMWPSE